MYKYTMSEVDHAQVTTGILLKVVDGITHTLLMKGSVCYVMISSSLIHMHSSLKFTFQLNLRVQDTPVTKHIADFNLVKYRSK